MTEARCRDTARAGEALGAARRYADCARAALRQRLMPQRRIDPVLLDGAQRVAHGYAWVETTVEALSALLQRAEALAARDCFDGFESNLLAIGFGEYLAQLVGGLPMGQNEIFRPGELGIAGDASEFAADAAVADYLREGNSAERRALLAGQLADGMQPVDSDDDDTLRQIRTQFRRFADQRILPRAQRWHLDNALLPDELIAEMAELGSFGICIPERFGGLGLGKLEMCIVTEELSRGWIGAGSLGTRSEIAAELILLAGTGAQQRRWLPGIARGEVLPTAVFTEPDTGSDLAAIATRAVANAGGWRISGAKTWITHASRSDLMTLLARTDPAQKGHAGLSMFLVPKPRGTAAEPFPLAGMSGSEIAVLGYRGMREYELAFDNLEVGADALLGDEAGQGFRQLMRTFESARIQTAARAVGVARRGLELALDYAIARKQFGRAIIDFPRVADKIAMMAVDCVLARELACFAAREKDRGGRVDVQAGMAKLMAARIAWANADAALQIHGGNGYALEFEVSRLLCDARILSIFEGTAEIQAQVIARGRLAD